MAYKILDLHCCETGSQNAYFTLRKRQKHTICTVPMGTYLVIEVPLFFPISGLFSIKRNYSQTAMPAMLSKSPAHKFSQPGPEVYISPQN